MLNLIAIVLLCLSLLMSWRVMRTLRSASMDYMKLKTMSGELQSLVNQSQSNLDQMKFLLEQADVTLNHKINEANLVIDDMKFVSDRSERIMDTIQRFIDMDNKLKSTVSMIIASEKSMSERSAAYVKTHIPTSTTLFKTELNNSASIHPTGTQASLNTTETRKKTFNLRDLAMKIVSSS